MDLGIDLEGVYRASPLWAQDALASLQGWRLNRSRYGGAYAAVEREVEARWSLEGSALLDLQARRLRDHLRAAESSPFWRVRFADCGVRPGASDPFAELARLPLLDKGEVQASAGSILNPVVPPALRRAAHTSGTTGAGLRLVETVDAERERWAVWWRYRHAFGITREMRSGHFGGRSVVPVGQTRAPYWRRNFPGRQLLLSAYHLSEDTVADYWRALDDWGAEWMHGYPSFLALFASLCRSTGLPPLGGVRHVTVGAENLLAGQRRLIEEYFGVPVRQHYGLAESVANFSERADGLLRVDEDFALVEFIAAGEGRGHSIVGTNWSNPAFPLFRYVSGDTASVDGADVMPRGNWRAVTQLDGRQEDFVVLPGGARVGRLDHIFKDLVHIREAQVYQQASGQITLRIVKGAGYDEAREEARLLDEARLRLGQQVPISVDYLAEIPKSSRGKLRFVVSDIATSRVASMGGDAAPREARP